MDFNRNQLMALNRNRLMALIKNAPTTLLFCILRFVVYVMRKLPLGLLQRVGALLGRLSFVLGTRMKKVTLINLKLCYPEWGATELNRLALDSLRSTAYVATEFGIATGDAKNNISRYLVSVKGESLLTKNATDARGILLLVPHFGNWEFINMYVSYLHGLTALYVPPKSHFIDNFVLALRKSNGGKLYAADTPGLRAIYKALKGGEIVGLLPDQVPLRSAGTHVPFFGKPALTMTLAARLIERTCARVVFGYALRLPDAKGFEIVFTEADDAVYAEEQNICLAAINKHIEDIVNLNPAQYQWEYKRFKRGPEGSVDVYR
ncbi:MAG: lysophospholipid acyltransferase family protein [Pseudomonadales bacterium]|nr:lysophospholipid acyltransferase family protein [Pseudomonadales bacterium]